ncbi:hypothetical protein BS78_05G074200 [Paspalum vaginatum]|nr:hypothetical protein BS78_05G074200 [Paspalum vaginatum]
MDSHRRVAGARPPRPEPACALTLLALLLCAPSAAAQKYSAIFNFGDSITDTGNLCTNGKPSQITFTQPPYGETYFGSPTCRCSDGRVVVDFLSTQFGLPFLPPSKSSGADFKQGANMAITGATAMDAPFFRSLGLSDKIWNNGPISFQLQWFQQIAAAVCGQSCKSYLANSLFVFGEFGGNDYNAMIFGGYSIEQTRKYTPKIVNTISRGIDKLIALGATDIVVPGVLPIGCFPIYLTIYGSSNASDYDDLGCLRSFNDLSAYHNTLLQKRVAIIQSRHRKTARVMYADFYAAVYDMVRNPQSYGFSSPVFETCCGSGGGKYNYQNSARCGMQGAAACASPAAHLSWDGIHLTEAAYEHIADGWLKGPYCSPPILHS